MRMPISSTKDGLQNDARAHFVSSKKMQISAVHHLLWHAHQDDGSSVERWDLRGAEQIAPPWTTRQFHCYTLWPPLLDHVFVVPRGAQFRCGMQGNIFVAGWEMPDSLGAWLFVSPAGQIE